MTDYKRVCGWSAGEARRCVARQRLVARLVLVLVFILVCWAQYSDAKVRMQLLESVPVFNNVSGVQ